MLVIALTGGIGSGKSAVTDIFASLGVPVIDTDIIARELVEPGQPAFEEIITAFGSNVAQNNGGLDRAKLREIIFSSDEMRHTLEAILHPRIRNEVNKRIRSLNSVYCIVVIPLLAETGRYESIHRVLVVDMPVELQIQRTMQRDHISAQDAKNIIATQIDRDTRLAMADDIIENTGDLKQLETRVLALHAYYMKLAHDYV